jgi:excisionase family DNA binding protein
MLSATQLARFCAVDLKTIHNWANRGKIPGTRTSGRHLRFRPLDVVDFLRTYGFDVPDGLRHMKLRVVAIDSDVSFLGEAKRLLGRRYEVTLAGHVVDGLLACATLVPDVVVAGDVSPLDLPTLTRRLAANEVTRHVRVVPRADATTLRDRIESLSAGGS